MPEHFTVIGKPDGRWYFGQVYQDEHGQWMPYSCLSPFFETEAEAHEALKEYLAAQDEKRAYIW